MKVQWQKLWVKILLWLGAEILLTSIGLDDLADYSEFLGQQKEVTLIIWSLKCQVPTKIILRANLQIGESG